MWTLGFVLHVSPRKPILSVQSYIKFLEMAFQDSTTPKVLLIWVQHSPCPFHALSPNILREVCSYIGQLHPCVLDVGTCRIKMYEVRTKTVRVKYTNFDLLRGAVYSLLEGTTILVAGGARTHKGCARFEGDSYIISNWAITQLPRMLVNRGNSGIYARQGVAYIFGGFEFKDLRTCEKYSAGQWLPLPDMKRARYSFTPVLHGSEVYLPCLSKQPLLESFSFHKEKFRSLPHNLPPNDNSLSVSFLTEDQSLVIISQSGNFYVYKEGSSRVAVVGKYNRNNLDICCCSSPVICKGREAYFRGLYEVCCFDLGRKELCRVADFTEVRIG